MPFITNDAEGLFISLIKNLEIRPSFLRTVSFLFKKSLFFLSVLDKDMSIKEPGLIFNSFLNDLISDIICIKFSTSLKLLSF